MNNNNFSQITDQQTITSMEIAEITGKEHYDVLKAIRKMEPAWQEAGKGKFSLSYRTVDNQTNRQYPYYILSKTECLFVATKFNDVARAKLVLRWEQLEKERLQGNNQPLSGNNPALSENNPALSPDASSTLPVDPRNMTRLQILQMALQAEQEKEILRLEKKELEDEKASMADDIRTLEADKYGLMLENGQKDQQIEQLEQRASYVSVIMADKSTVVVSQIAQDYGMGAPTFNKLLRDLRIQRKMGGQWVLYHPYLGKGYVTSRLIPIHHAGAPDTHSSLTVWTQAGRKFLYDTLKQNGILPLIERNEAAPLPSPTAAVGTRQGREGAAV